MVLKLVLEIKSRAKALDLISSTNLNTTTGSNYYLADILKELYTRRTENNENNNLDHAHES